MTYQIDLSSIINIISTVATVGALCVAFYFSYLESKERTKLLKEEQAAKIYVARYWDGLGNNTLIVNKSDCPIYEVFVFSVFNKSSSDLNDQLASQQGSVYISQVLPGEHRFGMETGGASAGGGFGVPLVFFTDCNSNEWVRTKDGKLLSSTDYLNKYVFGLAKLSGPFTSIL